MLYTKHDGGLDGARRTGFLVLQDVGKACIDTPQKGKTVNHQDILSANQVEDLAGRLWPDQYPLRLTRLHSESHQVYRVEGSGLDVVLKVEGNGDGRPGAIGREVSTIESLRGMVRVPDILSHGDDPKPYLVLPF